VRDDWQNLGGVVEALAAGNHNRALTGTLGLVAGVTGSAATPRFVAVAGLAARLADARSGDDVRSAFEAAATPVGGWQAKRYREGGRGSVTAFPGATAGAEWLVGDGRPGAALGLALPIGYELQLLSRADGSGTTTPGCALGVCSVGLFLPVLDLGGLVSYRVSGTEAVESTPNTSLRQVFAPGAFLSLGLGRTPATLLLGGQFMPAQRKVTDEEAGLSGNVFRFGVGISADVVLLRF
jgi:hypothetical protein